MTLKREFDKELDDYSDQFKKARDAAEKAGTLKSFHFSREDPWLKFAPSFLEIAESDPTGPRAVDAVNMALMTAHGEQTAKSSELKERALKLIRVHLATKPEIVRSVKTLVVLERDQKDGNILREVIKRNPDRRIQFEIYRRMIDCRETYLGNYKRFHDDSQQRRVYEKGTGHSFDADAHYPRAAQLTKELPDLKATLNEKYGDLLEEKKSIAVKTAIGQQAPAVVAQDLDGKTVDVKTFKGKVVVLDVWATWCGPCKSLIPSERAMVERLKHKPFVFVSISVDQDKQTLIDFLAKEKMPWPQWWVGVNSKFGDVWDIRHYPTIYVIDANGVIRDKELELRDDTEGALDKTVNTLLAEMEQFDTLKKEYEAAAKPLNEKYKQAFEAAKKAGKEKSFDPPKEFPPNNLYSPRFLALAEKNPDGPVALDCASHGDEHQRRARWETRHVGQDDQGPSDLFYHEAGRRSCVSTGALLP